MSSTNHTTNYNLPQYVGSDKPAWLGDINPAFSAIDTAMHNNAVAATSAATDATTANTNIGTMANLETTNKATLVGAVNEVNSAAGTAQGTANTAIGTAQSTQTALNNFMLKFNLNNFSNGSNQGQIVGVVSNDLSCAQNSDGSIFKVYGTWAMNGASTRAPRTAIAGMAGYYGVDVGITLLGTPSEAYIIKAAGNYIGNDGSKLTFHSAVDMAVSTEGKVYIFPSTSNAAVSPIGYDKCVFNPCVYFNGNFGDEPSPDD